MDAKPSHESFLGNRIFIQSQIYLNKLLMNYKGKKGTFTVEKSGGHQVIKVNITNNGINWHHVPPDVMHWGHNITYVLFLPKMHNLKLVMRKQSDKPKTEGQSTKNLTYTVQKCQCWKTKKGWEIVYVILDWILDQKTEIKDITATQDKGKFICGLYQVIVLH